MYEGDLGKEVALWRLTLLCRWSKAKFQGDMNFALNLINKELN
jgi:hypothetical protein